MKKGFTLVELLVVLAILGVLLTLVIPGMNHALTAGRTSASLSNLRQIGQLTAAYSHENRRYLPHGSLLGANRFTAWIYVLYPMAYDTEFPGFLADGDGTTGGNLRNTIFWSPNLKVADDRPNLRSYGWGGRLRSEVAQDTFEQLPLMRIRAPDKTAMCGDVRSSSALVPSRIHFRNADKALILFVDGHVEPRTLEQVPMAADDPDYEHFWFHY